MNPNTQSVYYEPDTTTQQNIISQQMSQMDPIADANKTIEEQRVQNALNTQLMQTGSSFLSSNLPNLMGMNMEQIRATQPFMQPTTNVGMVAANPATAAGIGTALDVGGQVIGAPDDDPYTFTGKEKAGRVMSGVGKGMGMGATIGSVIPGIGTVIGAGIGATVGGISSAFGTRKDRLEMEELQREQEAAIKGGMENQAFLRSSEKEYSGSNTGDLPSEPLLMGSEGLRRGGYKYGHGGSRMMYDEGGSKVEPSSRKLDLTNVTGETPAWMLSKLKVQPTKEEFMKRVDDAADWIGSSKTLAHQNYMNQLMYGTEGELSEEERERILKMYEMRDSGERNYADIVLSDMDYMNRYPYTGIAPGGSSSSSVQNLPLYKDIIPFKDFYSSPQGQAMNLPDWRSRRQAFKELSLDKGLDLSAEELAMIQQDPASYSQYFEPERQEEVPSIPALERRGGGYHKKLMNRYLGGGMRYPY
jgi:hypothetical protein